MLVDVKELFDQVTKLTGYSLHDIVTGELCKTSHTTEIGKTSLIREEVSYRKFRKHFFTGRGTIETMVRTHRFAEARQMLEALVRELAVIANAAFPKGTVELEGVKNWEFGLALRLITLELTPPTLNR